MIRYALDRLLGLKGLLLLVALLAVWQILGPESSPYFPPPSRWLVTVAGLAKSGRLVPALLATLISCVAGLAIATVFGFFVGLLIGRSSVARGFLNPTLEAFRGLPPPLLIPILVLLLGYSESMKLSCVVWVAIWPVLFNVATAAAATETLLLDVCSTLHLTKMARIRKVLIPTAIPDLLVGVRVAIPIAIIITLLVEMLTGLTGIGSLIVTSQRQFRSEEVYGLLILVGLIGLGFNYGFNILESVVLRRWPPRHQ